MPAIPITLIKYDLDDLTTCPACRSLNFLPTRFYKTEAWKIKKYSAEGCPSCQILETGLAHYDPGWEHHQENSEYCKVEFVPSETGLRVSLDGFGLDVGPAAGLEFFTMKGIPYSTINSRCRICLNFFRKAVYLGEIRGLYTS